MSKPLAPQLALYLRNRSGEKTVALTRAPKRKRPGSGGRAIITLSGARRDILYPRLSRIAQSAACEPLRSDALDLPEEYLAIDEWTAAKMRLAMRIAKCAPRDYRLIETLSDAAADMSAAEACWWLSCIERPRKAKRAIAALAIMQAPIDASPQKAAWLPRQPDRNGNVAALRLAPSERAIMSDSGSLAVMGAQGKIMAIAHASKAKAALPFIKAALGASSLNAAVKITEPQARKALLILAGAKRFGATPKGMRYAQAVANMHDCESNWWHAASVNELNPKDGVAAIAALRA